jgi:hypothetical protein
MGRPDAETDVLPKLDLDVLAKARVLAMTENETGHFAEPAWEQARALAAVDQAETMRKIANTLEQLRALGDDLLFRSAK